MIWFEKKIDLKLINKVDPWLKDLEKTLWLKNIKDPSKILIILFWN